MLGGDGDDSLNGDDGLDEIWGGAGWDTLYGGYGDDSLTGEEGEDDIWGGVGNDRLDGGTGDDILTGGTNPDVFLFDTDPAGDHGTDRITDFTPGTDRLRLLGGVQDFDALTLSETAAGLLIDTGAGLILLEALSLSDLTASDVIFV